jgi:uncharacterized membrane protein
VHASGDGDSAAPFVLILAATALLLLLGIEFFQVDDVTRSYFGDFSTTLRVNFQGWLLLSLAGSYAIYRIAAQAWATDPLSRITRGASLIVAGILVAGGLVYPLTTGAYFNDLSAGERHLTSLVVLERDRPDEYEAVMYLNREVGGTPVILEAVTASYDQGGRISSFIGLPTVLGWPMHTFWFHGSNEPQERRQAAVDEAYRTADPNVAAAILAEFDVEYVYAGWLEKALYGEAGLAKFGTFMDIAFASGEVTIYRAR